MFRANAKSLTQHFKRASKKTGPSASVKWNKGSNEQQHTPLAVICHCPPHSSAASVSVQFHISFKGIKEQSSSFFLSPLRIICTAKQFAVFV